MPDNQISSLDLKRWLTLQPPESLAGWLADAESRDPSLAIAIRCEVANADAGGIDPAAMREAIDRLAEVPPGTTWRDSDAIGNRFDGIVGLLTRALERGHAAEVFELAEHALRLAELAIMDVQDSEGWSGGILEELQSLHLRVCTTARPDPVALAHRWFDLRRRSPLGLYADFPEKYAAILGPKGVEEFERMELVATQLILVRFRVETHEAECRQCICALPSIVSLILKAN